ncbi:MAG: nitroreductase family protein [candidate division FCPU426 bacterium]
MDGFSQSVLDLISRRRSCRTYQPVPLEKPLRTAVEQALGQPAKGPFPVPVRFALLDVGNILTQPRKIGTYGTIQGAKQYIAGAVRPGPGALENFGYALEWIVLRATDLGLATCWLGGALHRTEIALHLQTASGEYIPAMTPVGLPAERPTLQDQALRWGAQAHARKKWEELFFLEESLQPMTPEAAGVFAPVLEAVRLGPSASNRQPWRVLASADRTRFQFYLKRNQWYSQAARVFLQAEDIQRLDMGIALCHFELAARELGLAGAWSGPPATSPAGWDPIAVWKVQSAGGIHK